MKWARKNLTVTGLLHFIDNWNQGTFLDYEHSGTFSITMQGTCNGWCLHSLWVCYSGSALSYFNDWVSIWRRRSMTCPKMFLSALLLIDAENLLYTHYNSAWLIHLMASTWLIFSSSGHVGYSCMWWLPFHKRSTYLFPNTFGLMSY